MMLLLLAVAAHCAAAAVAPGVVGRPCQLSNDATGVCTKRNDCAWAREELRQGRSPEICFKSLPTVIVCCPRTTDSADNPSRGDVGSNETTSVGDVARRKCKEYGAYVFQDVEVDALVTRRERKSQCATVDGLIVGGSIVKPMEFPHMALVGGHCVSSRSELECDSDDHFFFCGGSLIAPNFVLTAAHCLHARNKPVELVLLGSLTRRNESSLPYGQIIGVAERIGHPQYEPNAKYYDIALLRLAKDAVMSGHVRPACLHAGEGLGPQVPVATGWGFTDTFGDPSDVLQKVGLRLVDDETCRARYSDVKREFLSRGIDSATMLCAGGEFFKDTCNGDSGGPLQVHSGNGSLALGEPTCMYKIVGVTSFSKLACGLVVPGVYTRVSAYLAWLEKTVWPQQ